MHQITNTSVRQSHQGSTLTITLKKSILALLAPFTPFFYLAEMLGFSRVKRNEGKIVRALYDHGGFKRITIRVTRRMGMRVDFSQPVGVSALVDGHWTTRYYTVIDLKYGMLVPPTFDILVRRHESGTVSRFLHQTSSKKETVRIQPMVRGSEFFIRPAEKRTFISAGSGLTPSIGYLNSLRNFKRDSSHIVHFHVTHSREQVPQAYLDAAVSADPQKSQFIVWETSARGRPTFEDLLEAVPDLFERVVHIAGPAEFVQLMRDGQERHADINPVQNLYVEPFSLTAPPEVKDTDSDHSVQIKYQFGTTLSVNSSNAVSLLEAAENAGLRLPHGCRMGICHSCTAHLTEGSVININDGNRVCAPAMVQTCISHPVENCALTIHKQRGNYRR